MSRALVAQLRHDATRREKALGQDLEPSSPAPLQTGTDAPVATVEAVENPDPVAFDDPDTDDDGDVQTASHVPHPTATDVALNTATNTTTDEPDDESDGILILETEIARASPPSLRYSGQGWNELAQLPTPVDAARVQSRLVGGDDRIVRVIDDLRTQLLRSLESETWKRIAVTGPTTGCGASFTALNLALSLSRIPEFRTLLMDLDQRNPSVARTLGFDRRFDLGRMLTGEIHPTEHLIRMSGTLALGLNTERPQDPSERLHARRTHDILDEMVADLDPDIVIYDLPAMLDHDDVSAFLPQVDGVLLVADATRTLGAQIEECERRLAGKTPLLGVILNRGRRTDRDQFAA